MFDNLFSMEGPVARFIFLVSNLFILNLLTLVFLIPVFTAGPALKALAFTCLKIVREEDGNVVKTWFRNFKLNFGQSVLFGLICLLLILVGAGDIVAMTVYRKVFPVILIIPACIALFAIFGTLLYAIPMHSRFTGTIGSTFRNAFWAMLAKFPRTLLMIISFMILPSLYLFASGNFFPLLIMFGLSFPAYLNAVIYEPLFLEIEESIIDRSE